MVSVTGSFDFDPSLAVMGAPVFPPSGSITNSTVQLAGAPVVLTFGTPDAYYYFTSELNNVGAVGIVLGSRYNDRFQIWLGQLPTSSGTYYALPSQNANALLLRSDSDGNGDGLGLDGLPDTYCGAPLLITQGSLTVAALPIIKTAKDQGICGVGRCTVGNPVDVGSGNKYEQVTDYASAGPNALTFTRYYNSRAAANTSFASTLGSNWRSTFDRYFRIGSASSIAVERADGQILGFTQTSNVWSSDSDVDLKVVQSGSTYTLTDSNDTVETYTTVNAGQAVLSSIQFRNGYRQTLQYNASNQLTSVADLYNRTLTFTYQNGLLQTLTTPDGLVLAYSFTSSGASPGVLDRLSTVAYNTTPATSQTYLYETSALPFALTGITDENGNRFATWTYDSTGRGLSSQHAGGADLATLVYNDSDGSRTVTDPLGTQSVYHFSQLQGVPKVIEIDRLATSTTAAAKQLFTYDSKGYLASKTDWNGNLTTFVNDNHGQRLTTVEASGTPQARTTTATYHPTFHLPTQIVEPGLTTDLTYDGSGNLLTKTLTDTTTTNVPYSTNGTKRTWTYTWANGLLTSAKGPRTDVSALTSFTYDGSGTLVQTTNSLSQSARVNQHTPGGLPLTLLDANGVTTTLTYDARLRLKTSTVTTTTGPLTTTYQYDAAGNLLSIQAPDGSTIANTYDNAHRLTAIKDLFNQSTSYTLDASGDRTQINVLDSSSTTKRAHSAIFDALGRLLQDIGGAGQTMKYAYDSNGNTLTITDPLLRSRQQVFDALNRLTQVTDAANGITTTTYDAHNLPLSVTAPNGAKTTYVYDGLGELIQQVSPDSGTTVYRYDLAGNLAQKTDATGAIANYTYDALDRVLTATYPLDSPENVTYTYDQSGHGFGIGRLTSVADAVGTLSRSYDERGNLLSESRVQSGVTLLTSCTFDVASRLASITYPSGLVVSYARDSIGRTSGITAKKPGAANAVPVLSNISYQPFGPAKAMTYGNGVADSRTYDLDYRLTNLTDQGTSSVQNLTYGYDAANNVLTLQDGIRSANSQTLGYDSLDRLSSAAGVYGSISYTYDSVGNRLTQQLGSTLTTYTYTAQSNRLTSSKTGTATQAVSYTPAGNITTFTNILSTRPGTGMAYNQAGQLSKVLAGGAQAALYSYDAFGQRLAKVGQTTGTSFFQYDSSGHLLEQTDGTGHAQVDYIYFGDQPVATLTLSSSGIAFLHNDRLGTPQVATDGSQSVVWRADYQPFGSLNSGTSQTATLRQDLRFPGQEADADTGWSHNGFRDYVPTLGRYLQSDPIGLAAGASTYSYARNNALKKTDRRGLDDLFDSVGSAGTIPIDSGCASNPADCVTLGANEPATAAEVAKNFRDLGEALAYASLVPSPASPYLGTAAFCSVSLSYLINPDPTKQALDLAKESVARLLHLDKAAIIVDALGKVLIGKAAE